jgi:multidrug resistance efflux pump
LTGHCANNCCHCQLGQTLFTFDSPDLLAAESNLIAAVGVMDLTTRNLARLRELYKTLAVSQHDLEQAISDQQTAEGNLRAGRDSVRIFGKSDAEIDRIVADRLADPTLVVPSPINGRIVQRNAAPGGRQGVATVDRVGLGARGEHERCACGRINPLPAFAG